MNIGVIGAGVAGLTAANLLSEKYNVTLIEKKKRIGGHTNTINVEENGEKIGCLLYTSPSPRDVP